MIPFAKRNLTLFFRDKTGLLFSLLSVFIIIALYTVFLADIWLDDFPDPHTANNLMNSWLAAGLLAVASTTTSMGAFGTMVDDRARKLDKDFYTAPISRASITGGYLGGVFCVGVIMSSVMLVVAEIYVVLSGGALLSLVAMVQVFGLILLSTLASSAIIGFLVTFLKSHSAFSTASTILGTLIGFLTGIYLPVGELPAPVQLVIKLFPISHAASLLRQVMMEQPIAESFKGVPAQYVDEFRQTMGVVFYFGDTEVTPLMSIGILLLTAAVFYTLALLNLSRKRH